MSSHPLAMDHSSSSSISSSRAPWLMSLLSFTAGALSTSFLWYSMSRHRKLLDQSTTTLPVNKTAGGSDDGNAIIENGDGKSTRRGRDSSVERRSLSSSPISFLKLPSMEDIKKNIGELPSSLKSSSGRRKRWPWDRIRRTNSQDEDVAAEAAAAAAAAREQSRSFDEHDGKGNKSSSNNNAGTAAAADGGDKNDDDHADNDSASKDKNNNKSETCIGSIFGLDVGGSLAKLVYFECKADAFSTSPLSSTSPRHVERLEERRSRAAAAAQAVLLARRGATATTDVPATAATAKTSTTSWIPQSFDDDEDDELGEIHHGDYHQSVVPEDAPTRKPRSQSLSSTIFKRNDQHDQEQPPQSATSRKGRKKQSSPLPVGTGLRHVKNRGGAGHSKASEADLRKLYDLRQESVPANLHAYAQTYPTTVAAAAAAAATNKKQSSAITDGNTTTTANNDSSPTAADGAAAASTNATVTDTNQGGPDGKEMPRPRSMLNLSMNRDQKEALDRFYSFARRLDSYRDGVRDDKLSFYSRELGGDFHFIHFETRRMQHAMDLIRAHQLHKNISKMGATGGGAHRFAKEWQDQLGVAMDKQEELDSLVAGMQFTLSTVAGECYTFRPPDKMPPSAAGKNTNNDQNPNENGDQVDDAANASAVKRNDDNDHDIKVPAGNGGHSPTTSHTNSHHSSVNSHHSSVSHVSYFGIDDSDGSSSEEESEDNADVRPGRIDEWWWSHKVKRDAIAVPSNNYPYLLVTIGTGVSILRVDGPRQHERISGSTIGGGTYWGLIRLLTSVERFEDVLRLAERGDPSKCDMMVGDIYGNNPDALEKLGLPSNLVASSFGKLVAKEDPAEGLREEDLARALLLMVTNNIGQVAYLNAQLYKTSRIYFVGNFLRQNRISQRRLSFAIDYWSKGQMEALFLEHEGYFGALGAFLLSQGIDVGKQGGASHWKQEQSSSKSKKQKAVSTASSTGEDARTAARKLLSERQRSSVANFLHI